MSPSFSLNLTLLSPVLYHVPLLFHLCAMKSHLLLVHLRFHLVHPCLHPSLNLLIHPTFYHKNHRPLSPAAVAPPTDGSTPDPLPSSSLVLSHALAALLVPKSVDEALKDHRWLCAMQEEIQALKENGT